MTTTRTFTPMATILPATAYGTARVEHFTVTEEESRLTSWRGGRSYVPAGRYARLFVGRSLVMSDTRYEQVSNYTVVREARGDVLIAGLGLGMILVPIVPKAAVRSVTVIEQSADVVQVVLPALRKHWSASANDKLAVHVADIYQWRPPRGTKYDCLYFDIWGDQSTDDLADMATLHQAFKGYKAAGAWMDSWNRQWLKDQKRRGA